MRNENTKIKKIHPLLCQKKLPPPLSYSSHFWLMIETNESAHVQLLPCPRAPKCQLTLTLEKRAGQPAAAT